MLNNLQVFTQSFDSLSNHFNTDEQRALSLYIAELPAFLATQEGGGAARALAEEFLMYVAKKYNVAPAVAQVN